jgi:DNA polymerase III gamma/tau subunit
MVGKTIIDLSSKKFPRRFGDIRKIKTTTRRYLAMNKVILYDHRKTKPQVYDISTEEKERQAYKALYEQFKNWRIFNYKHKIEKSRDRIERLENPELENEECLFVSKRHSDRIEQLPKEVAESEINSLQWDIEKYEKYVELKERAEDGDTDAMKRLVTKEKGKPYAKYRILEVQNT